MRIKDKIKDKIKLWTEKFTEAWIACALLMVQGDLSVFTLNHALTAGKTGTLAACVLVLSSFKPGWDSGYKLVWLTGLATAMVDILVHPSNFGPEWIEAVCTGLGAMMLAYIYERIKK